MTATIFFLQQGHIIESCKERIGSLFFLRIVRIFFKNKTSCPISDGNGFFIHFILKKALLDK